MFATRSSRARIFYALRAIAVVAAATLMVVVTFIFPQWAGTPDTAGRAFLTIAVFALWAGAVVWIGVWLYSLYDNRKFKTFTISASIASAIGPLMAIAGLWGVENFRDFIVDALIIVSSIYAIVNVGILAFHRPDFINAWVRSGISDADAKAAREKKRAEKKSNMAKNGEPKVVDHTSAPEGEFSQPPEPTVSEVLAMSDQLTDAELVERILTLSLTFDHTTPAGKRVAGSWGEVRRARLDGSMSASVFKQLATAVQKKYPGEQVW